MPCVFVIVFGPKWGKCGHCCCWLYFFMLSHFSCSFHDLRPIKNSFHLFNVWGSWLGGGLLWFWGSLFPFLWPLYWLNNQPFIDGLWSFFFPLLWVHHFAFLVALLPFQLCILAIVGYSLYYFMVSTIILVLFLKSTIYWVGSMAWEVLDFFAISCFFSPSTTLSAMVDCWVCHFSGYLHGFPWFLAGSSIFLAGAVPFHWLGNFFFFFFTTYFRLASHKSLSFINIGWLLCWFFLFILL